MSDDIDQHSERTLGNRRNILKKLLWLLRTKGCTEYGTQQLQQFASL